MCLELRHAEFQLSSAREHFQIGGWMEGGRNFNGKLAISRKRWEIRPRLLLITNRKLNTSFQMKWKSSTLDDLESHWQPVRSHPQLGFFLTHDTADTAPLPMSIINHAKIGRCQCGIIPARPPKVNKLPSRQALLYLALCQLCLPWLWPRPSSLLVLLT